MANVAQPETREQIAQRIFEKMAAKLPGKDHDLTTGELCDLVAALMTEGVMDAISSEGEACARIADNRVLYGIGPMIAEDIRARGSK